MSKGLSKMLTKVGLPLGLGVVGSLTLVVWSQKPFVQPAMAVTLAPATVTVEEAASFDPYRPSVSVPVSATPIAAATPAPVIIEKQLAAPVSNGSAIATVSTGAQAVQLQPIVLKATEKSSVATRTAEGFTAAAVASATSDDCVTISAKIATINVDDAVINVLSSAKISYAK